MDTVMAGFAEHAHQLICVDMTGSIKNYFRETDRLKKELAPTRKHSVTREIFKSPRWCSKSWACSAISSNSFLTPSWCQKVVNCGQAIIQECLCCHFLRERNSSAFMAGCSNTESWWNAHFWGDDRLGPCKHISLISPSPSSLRLGGSAPDLASSDNVFQHVFSIAIFFFAIQL